MKRILLFCGSLLLLTILTAVIMGNSRWHLERNVHNGKPAGKLSHVEYSLFLDEAQRQWILLPQNMNAFHQPKQPVAAPPTPYEKAMQGYKVTYDPNNPNLKFLSEDGRGGSLEAILQPDGNYLESGPQLATYNYGHPDGLWGIIEHTLWDVLPHFANGNYRVP